MKKKNTVRRRAKKEEISPVMVFEEKPNATLPLFRCKWCNAEWIPRKNLPVECPSCKRRNWYEKGNVKKQPLDFED